MMISAGGRSALILATGLFVCLTAPSQSIAANAEDTVATAKSERATPRKFVRHGSRHWKRYSYRRHGRDGSKSTETKKSIESDAAEVKSPSSPLLPSSVANANAQMNPADVMVGTATGMSAKASAMLLAAADNPADTGPASNIPSVATDQLRDTDRTQAAPSTETIGLASAKAAMAPDASDGNDEMDKTSLIGKIFIGFGALLTMASAARMLMA